MKKTVFLSLFLFVALALMGCSILGGLKARPNISGTWNGEVKSFSGQVKCGIMKIVNKADGSFTGTLIGAGENGQDIPIDVITLDNATIHFEIPEINGIFDGMFDSKDSRITGIWLIGGAEYTVTMEKE